MSNAPVLSPTSSGFDFQNGEAGLFLLFILCFLAADYDTLMISYHASACLARMSPETRLLFVAR